MLVICGWISPVAHGGPNLSKENFSEATPTPTAQYLASGDSVGSTNYGGMVVAGIIAVLTAFVGAAIWRAHELTVKRDIALEAENQAAAARKGAEDIIWQFAVCG